MSFIRRKNRYEVNRGDKKDINPEYKVIVNEKPLSLASEAFRKVKLALDLAREGKSSQVVQFCSALKGEGKTTACLNVAATYAEEGKRVIIIDLDLRRARVHRAFGVENKEGVVDYLAGRIDKKTAIKHGKNGVDFINRGTSVSYPSTVLGSALLASLIDELRTEYDIVLIDCPPVLMVNDSCITAKLCDGTVFVVSSKHSEKSASKEAVSVLVQNKVNIYGCLLTESAAKNNSKYYYSDSKIR